MQSKNNTSKKILIIAGGTGGHIFPALAIANELKKHLIDVEWLGSLNGMEGLLVPKHGYNLHKVRYIGLRGKSIFNLFKVCFLLSYAFFKTIKIFIKVKPDIVIGMGGFVCGIGGVVAFIFRIPLVIHEQNAIVGTTNRILAKIANKIFQAFDNTFAANLSAITYGNPVLFMPLKKHKNNFMLNLLVLGGSLGAKPINDIVPLLNMKINIWHQTGKQHIAHVKSQYEASSNVRIDEFITDMAKAYAWADIVICRAGAMTISELMLSGTASILIPFPYATDNHQFYNAKILADNKAGILIKQKDFSLTKIKQILTNIDKKQIKQMEENATLLARPNAVNDIVLHLLTAY